MRRDEREPRRVRRPVAEDGVNGEAPVVFVVHSDSGLRQCIRELVESSGLKVRAYADAASFLSELPVDQAGCVVVGPQMCSMSASELQGELSTRGAGLPMILTADGGDLSAAVRALKAGVMDVIEARLLGQQMMPAILRAIAADLGRRSQRLERDAVQARYAQLTPRERQVARLVVAGSSTHAIARELGISEKTVEIHRSHINQKMRVRNAVELTRMMMQSTG